MKLSTPCQALSKGDRLSPSTYFGGDDEVLDEDINDGSILDSSGLPSVTHDVEVEPAEHPEAPSQLPRSSGDLWLSLPHLDRVLSCYTTIRTFGFILRLSPFTLKELCRDIAIQVGMLHFENCFRDFELSPCAE